MYLFQVAALLVEGSLCQEDADSVREKNLDKFRCIFCPYQQSESAMTSPLSVTVIRIIYLYLYSVSNFIQLRKPLLGEETEI